MSHTPINILIVDDIPTNIRVLSAMLQGDRYNLYEASNGYDALTTVKESDIDVVLLDINMPEMDGIQTAQHIREITGYQCHLPIIYVTAVTDSEQLSEALTWADDFIVKPITIVNLITKIEIQYQIRLLDKVRQREYQIIEDIFNNVTKQNRVDQSKVKFAVTPMSMFSGDVVLVNCQANRSIVFVGDFTGHGLPAAMGIIPSASTFYTLTASDAAIGDIARETNLILRDYLPGYMFLAGIYITVDHASGLVDIWSAAMPPAILVDSDGTIKEIIESMYLPLGAIPRDKLDASTYQFSASLGDTLYLCTDGIIEAENPAGDMFGETRYRSLFSTGESKLFEHILNTHKDFCGLAAQTDDISLVEIKLMPP